jgi:hypothetical protein
MKVLALVRDVKEIQIRGKDGKPDWKKFLLVVEHSDPLELMEVELTRPQESQLDQFRKFFGKTCIVPMNRYERRSGERIFVAWRLEAMPAPVAASVQQPQAVAG